MRNISRRRLVQTIVALLRQRPNDRPHIVSMLAAYLIVHRQINRLDLVLLDLARELQIDEGLLYAEVLSAFPLDDAARLELEGYLKRTTGAKRVELDERVDADLLAGMIVRTAELELDTSARTKLARLRNLRLNMSEKV